MCPGMLPEEQAFNMRFGDWRMGAPGIEASAADN